MNLRHEVHGDVIRLFAGPYRVGVVHRVGMPGAVHGTAEVRWFQRLMLPDFTGETMEQEPVQAFETPEVALLHLSERVVLWFKNVNG